jgi:eukaryotic-like serine/threonine-protein kinase
MTTLLDPALSACPRCGTPYRDHARFGFCSRCVATVSFADAETPPPEEDELAAVLPRSAVATTAPTRFGDYEFLDEIARGGMGVIYRARQRSLQRIVAVKMLLFGGMADPDLLRRFRNEAAAAAALEHPHIVRILDVGEHESQPFIAMEYVSGTDLGQLVRERPLGARQAARYVEKISRAIEFAHQHGVLHRDLKPSNVILDALDEPRVTDFGLARNLAHDSDVTLTGQALGSPNFMPPEQARGDLGHIGPSSDVYGLGAILYHLLTARPPFLGETVEATLAVVCDREPVSPRQLNAEIPPDLETICLKCLEKEPAKRYPTAQALADDLQRFLNDEPILARPVTRLERAWRWCRRKPALASAYGLLLLLVLVLSIASPIAAYRIDQARQEAVHQARQAGLNQYVADINLAAESLWTRHTPGRARELLAGLIPETGEDLRGWEWYYLWGQVQSDAAYKLGEHPDNIRALALSPDGTLLGSSDWGGAIALWDVPTRRQVRLLRMPGVAHQLRFYSDQILVVANQSGSVSFHNVPDGVLLHRIETGAPVHAISLTPSRDRLAALFSDGELATVRVWYLRPADSPETVPFFELAYDIPAVQERSGWLARHAVAFSPSGTELAAGYSDGVIRIYDAATGNERRQLTGHTDAVSSLAWSSNGRWLVSGAISLDWLARVWDSATGGLVATLPGAEWEPRALAFSRDDAYVFIGRGHSRLEVWRTEDWSLDRLLQGHNHHINALVAGHDAPGFFTGSTDRQILAWDVSQPSHQPTTVRLPALRSFDWSPAGDLLATIEPADTPAGQDRAVLRDTRNLAFVRELPVVGEDPTDIAFTPDGRHLAILVRDSVSLFEVAQNRLVHSGFLPNPGFRVIAGFSANGRELILINGQLEVTVWDARHGHVQEVWSALGAHPKPLFFGKRGVAFHAASGRLVIGRDNGVIAVWDVRTQQHLADLHAHLALLPLPAISPDGATILSAGQDGRFNLWDSRTLTLRKTLRPIPVSAWAAAFSPDGRRVAIGRRDRADLMTVTLIDIETGRELLSFPSAPGVPSQIAWSPDGTTLLARQDNGRAWMVPANPESRRMTELKENSKRTLE